MKKLAFMIPFIIALLMPSIAMAKMLPEDMSGYQEYLAMIDTEATDNTVCEPDCQFCWYPEQTDSTCYYWTVPYDMTFEEWADKFEDKLNTYMDENGYTSMEFCGKYVVWSPDDEMLSDESTFTAE